MPDNETRLLPKRSGTPWNKVELIGAKPPLRPKHVRSIRTRPIGRISHGFEPPNRGLSSKPR